MNAAQEAAFSAGAAVPPQTVLLTIALIAALLYLTWLAWIAQAQYRAWVEHRITLFDLTWTVLRASILVLLVGYFLRP